MRLPTPVAFGLAIFLLSSTQFTHAQQGGPSADPSNADSSALHETLAGIAFRSGDFDRAERELLEAMKEDQADVSALLELAQIYESTSQDQRAFELIKKAHDTAPTNAEVRRKWLAFLPHDDRRAEVESYLANVPPDSSERAARLYGVLEFLKALDRFPDHRCELVSGGRGSERKLRTLFYDPINIRGWSLEVSINDRKMNLLFDTGSSGIVISRAQALKAGVVEITPAKSESLGGQGQVYGSTAFARSIRLGQFEFRNCVIHVVEGRHVMDSDGLIGSDVFRDYLVEINYPERTLKLSPFGEGSGESQVTPALNSLGYGSDIDILGSERRMQELAVQGNSSAERKRWVRFFRLKHLLLIPTRVNGHSPKLFLVDSGATATMLSTQFAREVTVLKSEKDLRLEGVSGGVKDVYRAKKVLLEFANLRQEDEQAIAFDLSPISQYAGTEISGIVGISVLKSLRLKIDYQHGLMEFVDDAKQAAAQSGLQ